MGETVGALGSLLAAADAAYDEIVAGLEVGNPALRTDLLMLRSFGSSRKVPVTGPLACEWPYVRDVHRCAHELDQSWRSLQNVPIYIRQFPFRDVGVSRADYLQYHWENWFGEFFILDERFRQLCKVIEDAAWADDDAALTVEWAAKIRQHMEKGLKEARLVRNAHIHERRVFDMGIDALRQLEPQLAAHESSIAQRELKRQFRCLRHELAESLRVTNELLDVLLEDVFGAITALLADGNGRLRRPLSNNGIERTPSALD